MLGKAIEKLTLSKKRTGKRKGEHIERTMAKGDRLRDVRVCRAGGVKETGTSNANVPSLSKRENGRNIRRMGKKETIQIGK